MILPKFKTGGIYLCKQEESVFVLEILNDSYNLPFILVNHFDAETHKGCWIVNQNLLEPTVIKYLGNNKATVQVLLGNKGRGTHV